MYNKKKKKTENYYGIFDKITNQSYYIIINLKSGKNLIVGVMLIQVICELRFTIKINTSTHHTLISYNMHYNYYYMFLDDFGQKNIFCFVMNYRVLVRNGSYELE